MKNGHPANSKATAAGTGATGSFRAKVYVCAGTECGGGKVLRALKTELRRRRLLEEVLLAPGRCRGLCAVGPVVVIEPAGILYCHVQPADVAEIVAETLREGRIIGRLAYQEPAEHQAVPSQKELPFFSKQVWIALHNCGVIDPEKIEEYLARDGYRGLGKARRRCSRRM